MGMFDDVLLDPGLKCKKCGKGRITYMQTKDFHNMLDKYKEDHLVPWIPRNGFKHKIFNCYGECPKCKEAHGGVGLITDNIFRGIVEYTNERV